jgi:hypothetical protein
MSFRTLFYFAACLPLCSCGVYQVMTDTSTDHDATAFDMISPITMITGSRPDTRGQNFKPDSYYDGLIKARNQAGMTPEWAQQTLIAMDRRFHDPSVKRMPLSQVQSLFGTPDSVMRRDGSIICVYRIGDGKLGERWLALD